MPSFKYYITCITGYNWQSNWRPLKLEILPIFRYRYVLFIWLMPAGPGGPWVSLSPLVPLIPAGPAGPGGPGGPWVPVLLSLLSSSLNLNLQNSTELTKNLQMDLFYNHIFCHLLSMCYNCCHHILEPLLHCWEMALLLTLPMNLLEVQR